MKLSTRSRYCTRVLVELVLHGNERISLGKVTSRHRVSRSYVEHSIAPLVDAGIIKSQRGFGGGIQLARHPAQIRLGEVVRLLEGNILILECVNKPELCTFSRRCSTRGIWKKVENALANVLDSITLQELADHSRTIGFPVSNVIPKQEEGKYAPENIKGRYPDCIF